MTVSSARSRVPWHHILVALLCALSLMLLLPGTSEAHAILVRSDPAQGAILPVAQTQVRMWFSEAFNPALSTAAVVNEVSARVDIGDAHVSPDDPTEMDVDLKPNVPPGVYVVVYRTDSTDDGHVLTASFSFTVARPDGTVPTLSPGANPGANILGSTSLSGQYTGQLDGPTLFNLIMITLVEIGAVFYAGAAFWQLFVLQPASEEHEGERDLNRQAQQRFDRWLAFPTLVILLLANVGVLLGQALAVTNGEWGAAFSPTLLVSLISSGRFGVFWLMREIVLLVALQLTLYPLRIRIRAPGLNTLLLWFNVIVSLVLFLTIALTSHAAATEAQKMLVALIADWLHLVAAALWVGSMMYIATSYLPVLRRQAVPVQARSLTTILPYYTLWALAGVIIMAVTGPFSATMQLSSWTQLFATAYGRALVVKVLLVGGLLLTSSLHVFLLRPRLKKEYRKYTYAFARLQATQKVLAEVQGASESVESHENKASTVSAPVFNKHLAQEVNLREARLTRRTRVLTQVLRWEPVLGVAVLICVGLLNVFAGTLSPIAPVQSTSSSSVPGQTLHPSARTSDGIFTIALQITPGQVGSNAFLVTVQEAAHSKAVTDVSVSLSISDLDMNMGTQTIALQPDGKGHFSGLGNLLMSGHWQIGVQVRTPDRKLHVGVLNIQAP